MSLRTIDNLLLIGASTLSTMMIISQPGSSMPINEVIENSTEEELLDSSIDQMPSVSQFSDVQPRDWAFQSLQSLIERYGVFFTSSDGKFRGHQALTRYEFASILNQVLTQFNDLIITGKTGLIKKEDLVILQKLKAEFSEEIVTLNDRVNTLESQTNKLEKSQFSSTTKLTGEAIFAVTDMLSGDDGINRVNNEGVPNLTPRQNTVFASRVRLNFNSSFTGQDQLTLRLQKDNFNNSTNFNGFTIASGFTNFTQGGLHQSLEGQQTFNSQKSYIIGSPSSEGIVLDSLRYTFPIGTGTKVVIAASGGEYADYVPTLNPYLEDFDGGNGAVSSFAQRSPIYRMGSDFGAGIGLTTKLIDTLTVNLSTDITGDS
jgi:Carbohydrate-selective porin, OprB family/S-layer homology domain